MKKKNIIRVAVIGMAVCAVISMTISAVAVNDYRKAETARKIVRCSERCMCNASDEMPPIDKTAYVNSGLEPVFSYMEDCKETCKIDTERTISIGGQEYVSKYISSSKITENTSDFLRAENYDRYEKDDFISFIVFQENGKLRNLFIDDSTNRTTPFLEKSGSEDFSDEELEKASAEVLHQLYGEEIDKYLKDYYVFESVERKTDNYDNVRKYEVTYRAYVEDVATDDIISIEYTAKGKLSSVMALKYLRYVECEVPSENDIKEYKQIMKRYLKDIGYSKISEADIEAPEYIKFNNKGEVYYVVEWDAIIKNSKHGCPMEEILAIKVE